MSVVRVRQHVNPLGVRFQQKVALPDWQQVFAQPTRPLHLDIGCARGRFLLQMAALDPTWNFLGLEIRQPLVEEANAQRDRQTLTNLHFLFCNVNIMLADLLQSLPDGVLQRVSLQFPDPWFKRKHHKRRVIQPEIVEQLAAVMPAGAQVFVQSDVLAIAQQMRTSFAAHAAFVLTREEWLPDNPLAVPTERELATLNKGEPVYRALLVRQP